MEVFLLHLGGAVLVDHPCAHVVNTDVGGGANAASGQSLKDEGGLKTAEAATTIFFTHIDASKAQVGCLLVLLNREVFGLVPLGGVGLELSLCKAVSHILNHFLFFVEELVVDQKRDRSFGNLLQESPAWSEYCTR